MVDTGPGQWEAPVPPPLPHREPHPPPTPAMFVTGGVRGVGEAAPGAPFCGKSRSQHRPGVVRENQCFPLVLCRGWYLHREPGPSAWPSVGSKGFFCHLLSRPDGKQLHRSKSSQSKYYSSVIPLCLVSCPRNGRELWALEADCGPQ